MTLKHEPQDDFFSAWREVLERHLTPGHLVRMKLESCSVIVTELVLWALADEVTDRVGRASGCLDRGPANEHDRLDQLVHILDDSVRLNEKGVLARFVNSDSRSLPSATHVAVRELYQAEVNRRYQVLDPHRRADLAGDIYTHDCVARPRIFENWDPSRGGLQSYLRLCVRPGTVPIKILRDHGIEYMRHPDRRVYVERIDKHSESKWVLTEEQGYEDLHDRDAVEDIRANVRERFGSDIDETIRLKAAGYSIAGIATLMDLPVDSVRARLKRVRRQLRHYFAQRKDDA